MYSTIPNICFIVHSVAKVKFLSKNSILTFFFQIILFEFLRKNTIKVFNFRNLNVLTLYDFYAQNRDF